MITSRVLDMVHFDELPGGQNAIIAVMSFTGYDIEDATILNKASLDRGFGRCMVTRKHVAHVKKYTNGTCDRIVGPPADAGFGVRAVRCVLITASGCVCWRGVGGGVCGVWVWVGVWGVWVVGVVVGWVWVWGAGCGVVGAALALIVVPIVRL